MGQVEYRAVQTYILATDVATAAFTDTTFHTHFQSGDDLFVTIAHLLQSLQNELDHDRRPTGYSDGSFRTGIEFLQIGRHKSYMTVPTVFRIIDGYIKLSVLLLRPLLK